MRWSVVLGRWTAYTTGAYPGDMRRIVITGLLSCAPSSVTTTHATLVPVQGTALLDSTRPPPGPPEPSSESLDTPVPGPPMPLSPPGPQDGQIGTAHHAIVTAADPQGRWVLICQARVDSNGDGWIHFGFGAHGINEGDEAGLYFVRGSGEGEAVTGLIARDASGRWLVLGRDHDEISLLDLDCGTSTALYPAITSIHDELYPLKPSRIQFDPSGQYLLYRRRSDGRDILVVRQLETGSEQFVDPGPGTLISAGWEGSAWLRLRIVRDDVNGDHEVELPEDSNSLWAGTCGLGSTTFMAGWSPDIRVEHVAWSTGLRLDHAHTSLGDELLIADAGKITAVTPSGTRRTLALAPGCRPIHGDAARGQVLADCDDSEATQLEVLGAHGQRRLGRVKHWLYELRVLSPRLLELTFSDRPNYWLDLEQLRLYHQTPGYAAAAHGKHALIRGDRDVLVDLAAGRERVVLGRTYWSGTVSAGRHAYAYPWLVDLERGKRLARIEEPVHAVTSDGRLLVDVGAGELRWRTWQEVRRTPRRR